VAVKLTGLSKDGLTTLQKTSVGDREMVRKMMLTQFTFAEPAALGITENFVWMFCNSNENKVEGKRVLGSGLHGSVLCGAGQI
jgi:hypothetical protein